LSFEKEMENPKLTTKIAKTAKKGHEHGAYPSLSPPAGRRAGFVPFVSFVVPLLLQRWIMPHALYRTAILTLQQAAFWRSATAVRPAPIRRTGG